MDQRVARAFLLLVLAQAAHSVEEYVFRLFEVLAPARLVSGLFGLDPATGFAIVNSGLVLFGFACWLGPAKRGGASGRAVAWGWAAVESANGLVHLGLAVAAGGYFPGLYTAPLLIAAGAWLATRLSARDGG
jgi:Protein of unknown function with HXXEE motif